MIATTINQHYDGLNKHTSKMKYDINNTIMIKNVRTYGRVLTVEIILRSQGDCRDSLHTRVQHFPHSLRHHQQLLF